MQTGLQIESNPGKKTQHALLLSSLISQSRARLHVD